MPLGYQWLAKDACKRWETMRGVVWKHHIPDLARWVGNGVYSGVCWSTGWWIWRRTRVEKPLGLARLQTLFEASHHGLESPMSLS